MRVLVLLLPLVAACDRLFAIDHLGPPPDADPATIDAFVGTVLDAGPCASPAQQFGRYGANGAGLLSVCLVPDATTLALSGLITTDSDPRCVVVSQDTIGTDVCMISAANITIDAALDTRGDRPLVLLAYETLTVNATIDVAGHTYQTRGAASNWLGCGVTQRGDTADAGGGGGAGGSVGTKGGDGGTSAQGVRAAAKDPASEPDRIRGGCPGGNGGLALGLTARASGGHGGGAIYLIATTISLTSNASINASGGGGHGGPMAAYSANGGAGAGGGGGGAGGLIALDAATILADPLARLIANGGGGGAGGSTVAGGDGSDPSGMVNVVASGGLGGSDTGGMGGAGAAGTTSAGEGGSLKSGGGGGGGQGWIRLYTKSAPPVMPARVSPAWVVY